MTFPEAGQDRQEEDAIVDVHHEREQVWSQIGDTLSVSVSSLVFVRHQIFSDDEHHCGQQRA